jgi:hypothetical protein
MSLNDLKVSDLQWRKARRSANNGACVEVATTDGQVFIRDSKNLNGAVMRYPGYTWRVFLSNLKIDQFDPKHL